MKMSEQVISRVLSSVPVTLNGIMVIHLAPILLLRSSDPPWDSDGLPSNVPLLGLAPGGVCHASVVANGAVSSYLAFSPLPNQTNSARAVCFLWHFPSRHRDWVLPSTLPCGARTFLPSACHPEGRPFALLQHQLYTKTSMKSTGS
jgi:hypothetical protein